MMIKNYCTALNNQQTGKLGNNKRELRQKHTRTCYRVPELILLNNQRINQKADTDKIKGEHTLEEITSRVTTLFDKKTHTTDANGPWLLFKQLEPV